MYYIFKFVISVFGACCQSLQLTTVCVPGRKCYRAWKCRCNTQYCLLIPVKIRVKNKEPLSLYEMEKLVDETGRLSPVEDRTSDMEQDESMNNGRDSPIKPSGGVLEGEDILAKLRQQVSAASLFTHAREGLTSPPRARSPNNNNIDDSRQHLYDRLHTILQAKMKKEDDDDENQDSREMLMRAEALHRQRESLLSSPQALMNAMRAGIPPPLIPPGGGHPFLPASVGLPPTTNMPPTPGSAGSRNSSGDGLRTPSHTPEPHMGSQSWSFEEQFKQVAYDDTCSPNSKSSFVREPAKHSSFEEDKRKLYELSDDLKRKDFLDDLFAFMQKRGTPINRLPIMAKQVLDLYELFNLVVARGGLVEVINKKLWQEIIKGLKLPSSITSAAFTLRTQYMKYIYPYECEKEKLSNPMELQSAIDGNRREGRRSTYGSFGDMVQPPFLPLQNLQNLQNLQSLQNPLLRPQLNGNVPQHPLAPQDFMLGRGGSPPGSQEALLEAARHTMWKLYNHAHGGAINRDNHDDESPKLPPPHHILPPAPFPPQESPLNLTDMKEESMSPFPGLRRPSSNMKDPAELTFHREEREPSAPPNAKRQLAHDDPQEVRIPPHNNIPSPGLPGANIKITSRGDGRNNDQSLVVSMEINGVIYQGVLFAQAPHARLNHNNQRVEGTIL